MSIIINKFTEIDLIDPKNIIVIGFNNTCKELLIKDILVSNNEILHKMIITKSVEKYKDLISKDYIYNSYDEDSIDLFIENTNSHNKSLFIYEMTHYSYNINNMDNEIINNLYIDKNIYNTSFILSYSYGLHIPYFYINNANLIFILHENISIHRKKIYDNYCTLLCTYEYFNYLLDTYTNEYSCLVINKSSKTLNLKDIFYCYEIQNKK